MKTTWFDIRSALSFVAAAALVTACGAGDFSHPESEELDGEESSALEDTEVGSLEQGYQNCSNPDGVNAVMAALAVAVGQDLKRWDVRRDFEVYNTSAAYEGAWGWQQAIRLLSGTGTDGKPRGKSRCADGQCGRVQALLALQYDNARNQVWVQGENSTSKVLVDPPSVRSRIVAKFGEQKSCDDAARDGDPTKCPREAHLLSPAGLASLGGCGPHYMFNATKDPWGTLLYPGQLKWKLGFADQANGWVDFRDLGNGRVAIDPTYGLNEDATVTAGACTAACTKISMSNIAGQCCSCGGVAKTYRMSTFSSAVFLCQ